MLSMPTKFREPRALLMMADTRPNTTGPAIMIQSHQLKRATLPGSNMSVSLTSMSLGGAWGEAGERLLLLHARAGMCFWGTAQHTCMHAASAQSAWVHAAATVCHGCMQQL